MEAEELKCQKMLCGHVHPSYLDFSRVNTVLLYIVHGDSAFMDIGSKLERLFHEIRGHCGGLHGD